MFRHISNLLVLLLLPGAGCNHPPLPNQPSPAPLDIETREDVISSARIEPVVESEPEDNSVYKQLLEADFVAVFAEETGVMVYDGSGRSTTLIGEPFNWLTIDYSAGLMWLDRGWSKTHDPGIFVVDLLSREIALTKVTRLTRGDEIIDFQGQALLLTEGRRPYHIRLNVNPVLITLEMNGMQCGDECILGPESVALFDAARLRGPDTMGARVRRLTPPSERRQSVAGGHSVALGQLPLSLRLFDWHRDIGWFLHDDASDEYVASMSFARSKRPPAETYHVKFLMVCEGEDTLIVERAFLTSDLMRLDPKKHKSYGLCLRGGLVFQDRTGFRFVEP